MKLLNLPTWQKTCAVQPASRTKLFQDFALTCFFTRPSNRRSTCRSTLMALVPLWLWLHVLFVSTVAVANTPAPDVVASDVVVSDRAADDASADDVADEQPEESVENVALNSWFRV